MNLRQKTLLIFLQVGESQEIDPIRIMKGLFLFTMEAPIEWIPAESRYSFVPFHYGPCSFEIYSDLDQMEESGYVGSREVLGQSWKYYSLTLKGKKLVSELTEAMNPNVAKYLRTVRVFVDRLSFRRLLSLVYRQYPDYAVNSVFKF